MTRGTRSPCGHFTVGAAVLGADCRGGTIPDTLAIEVYDGTTGQDSNLGSVTGVPGACQLSSQSKDVIAQVNAAQKPPGSVIVIADFIPVASATLQFTGMDVRCQAGDCLTVLLNNDGNYGIYEALGPHGTDLVMGKIDNDKMPAGHLRVGEPNRLLVWVKGDRAAVYLNGRVLGEGGTTLPDAPSGVDFTAVPGGALGGGSGDSAVVKLVHLYIFQAA